MANPTKVQQALMHQLGKGRAVDVVASNLGKSVLGVRRQIARSRKRIESGYIRQATLPIEKTARTSRVYLAGFDVFQIDAVDHGACLKDLCREHSFFGIYPFDSEALPDLAPAAEAVGGSRECLRELKKFGFAEAPVLRTRFAKRSFVYIGKGAIPVYLLYE